jgi:threonine dehydratase
MVCVSTGNTGKAAALAGKRWAIETHMFCSGDPARPKRELLDQLGVVLHSGFPSFSSASESAADFASCHDFLFVSPGASWPFAYGASAIVDEILADAPDTSAILAPIGGGGLASGLGLGLCARGSGTPRLFGVQAANSPYVYNLFHDVSGPVQVAPTVADCIAGDLEGGAIIRDVAHEMLADVFLVSDAEIASAVRELEETGITVEPGAAAAYAAIRAPRHRQILAKHKLCVVISGGR